MNYPDVGILIVTYDRANEMRKTIYSLLKHIVYPREKLHWHIADDNTGGSYIESIISDYQYLDWTFSVTGRKGWGANVNTALKMLEAKYDYAYLNEDDYVARDAINLEQGVTLMENIGDVGLVRYDGLAAHKGIVLYLNELKNKQTRLDYLILDKQRSKHLNVYSNRPHLRHKRFTADYGYYLEGRKLGHTEEEYAHRIKDAEGKQRVAILDSGIRRAFDHIGKSRQNTKEDVGK